MCGASVRGLIIATKYTASIDTIHIRDVEPGAIGTSQELFLVPLTILNWPIQAATKHTVSGYLFTVFPFPYGKPCTYCKLRITQEFPAHRCSGAAGVQPNQIVPPMSSSSARNAEFWHLLPRGTFWDTSLPRGKTTHCCVGEQYRWSRHCNPEYQEDGRQTTSDEK